MSIFHTLGQKPWEDKTTGQAIDQTLFQPRRLALNFFLAVMTVLFTLFIVTFLARSQYPDFKALAGDVWQPFYNTGRLWINTLWLLASSASIHGAYLAFKNNKKSLAVVALVVSLLFALQFLTAQILIWGYLQSLGFSITSNPANSYFYVLTALHGVHLIGGVLVLAFALVMFWRHASTVKLAATVQLCVRYWHYLFVLWLVLFGLTVSSPATFKTLAALCGY